MEFRYGGGGNGPPPSQYWQQLPPLPSPTGYTGYWRPRLGVGNDYFCPGNGQAYESYRQGFGLANDCFSSNDRAAIQRETEKERIRGEIILEEIGQLLEAEEMRIGRELAPRLGGGGGSDRFLFPAGVEPRGIAFQQEGKGLSLEERIAMRAAERSRTGPRSETRGI